MVVIQQLAVVFQDREIIIDFLLVLGLLCLRVLRAQTQAALRVLHCDYLEAQDAKKSWLEIKHFYTLAFHTHPTFVFLIFFSVVERLIYRQCTGKTEWINVLSHQ